MKEFKYLSYSAQVEYLRPLVLEKLEQAGFICDNNGNILKTSNDKDDIRKLHEPARNIELKSNHKWLKSKFPNYQHYFADGSDIDPENIQPSLIEVNSQSNQDLFRIARLLWSLPYSKGYGRRLRFLILDKNNNKLIGILALQSPPLSFPARDRKFHYPPDRKTELINQTMDIHTLGAISPYNKLLGGKLIALSASSNEIRTAYRRKYHGRKTEMQGRVLPSHLVALTTTSAFGRSSIYNRLRFSLPTYGNPAKRITIAESLGFTEGYGSFHLMELYPLFRLFLENQGISTRGGFGKGPRIKWQTMVRALDKLGFSGDLLRHGIKREAFIFPLIENLSDYFEGIDSIPIFKDLPFSSLVSYWQERWLLPRASRINSWRLWNKNEMYNLLGL